MGDREEILASQYVQLADEELLRMHRSGRLTDVAYGALEKELRSRNLTVPPRPTAPVIEVPRPLLDRMPFWTRLVAFILAALLVTVVDAVVLSQLSTEGAVSPPSFAPLPATADRLKLFLFEVLPILILAKILLFRERSQTEPKGLGGWLILPLLVLLLSPVWLVFRLVGDLLPAFSAEAWSALTAPGASAYHPSWAPLLIFEFVADTVLLLLTLVLLWLFLRKSRRVPKLFIGWSLLLVAVPIVELLLASQVPIVASESDENLGRAIVAALIWIPYFMRSKRVKNTFVESVS